MVIPSSHIHGYVYAAGTLLLLLLLYTTIITTSTIITAPSTQIMLITANDMRWKELIYARKLLLFF